MFRFRVQLHLSSILVALLDPTFARPPTLAERAESLTPAPLTFTPAENWDGIDGQWSTFTVRVGNPAQYIRVYAATSSQQVWVVDAGACQSSSDIDACQFSRGWVFNSSESTSWVENGWFALGLERNLGFSGNGHYGYDDVGLSDDASGLPTIPNATVGTFQSQDFWLGHLGLHPKPTNFSSFNDRSPSYMTYLKEQGHIPSLTYGYTAGNQYRFTKVSASLTLGGFDASRFIANDLSINFAPDNERDLVVALQRITAGSTDLLPSASYMFIDSTVSELWLPIDACEQFESEFGLVFDNETRLYLVNDTLHDSLLARDANVTFTLAAGLSGGTSVDIILPYAAFDLVAKSPYRNIQNDTNYFPLRRAQNSTQYTLGRTFLQEAYVIVNHEVGNFSVFQCNWALNNPSNIVAINSSGSVATSTAPDTSQDSGLSTAVIIGVVVGVVGGIVITAASGWCFWRRWKSKHLAKLVSEANAAALTGKTSPSDRSADANNSADEKVQPYQKAELPAHVPDPNNGDDEKTLGGETHGPAEEFYKPPVEADADELQIYEMPGSLPEVNEKDGRQYSEKEALQHRERVYNGTDPVPVPSPLLPEYTQQNAAGPRRQVTMADVAPIVGTNRPLTGRSDGTGPAVSPMTPGFNPRDLIPRGHATPTSSDGSRTLTSEPRRRRFSFEDPTDDERTMPST